MGIVTGDAGLGKTIAVQTYLQDLKPRTYSGFPACVALKVSPRSTAKALAKTLTAFFREVTEPVAEMIEALYLSPLLRERHMVWEIGGRMARSSGVTVLPEDVVTGVCASILRERAAMLRKGIQSRSASWEVTWRPTPVQIQWPHLIEPTKNSFVVVVVVTEEMTGEGSRAPRGGRVGAEGGAGGEGEV